MMGKRRKDRKDPVGMVNETVDRHVSFWKARLLTVPFLAKETGLSEIEVLEVLEDPRCVLESAGVTVDGEGKAYRKSSRWYSKSEKRVTHAQRQKTRPPDKGPSKVRKQSSRYHYKMNKCKRCGKPIVGGNHSKSKSGHGRTVCDGEIVKDIMER